jgi:hypothetical protein
LADFLLLYGGISVFESYEEIVDRCCEAWNFFAQDKKAITSITSREWAKTVTL